MFPGVYPVGAMVPLCGIDPADDHSVLSSFEQLLADEFAARLYLIEAEPYDPELAGTVIYRWASDAYVTRDDDDPPSEPYEPRAVASYTFSRSIGLGKTGLAQRATEDYGELRLAHEALIGQASELDALHGLQWDGRDVTIKLGQADWSLDEFGTIFRGTALEAAGDRKEMRIRLRSPADRLDRALQTNLYAGSGGMEGGADLAGRPKPLCFGKCLNLTPVVVDRAQGWVQVHDGPIQAVDGVYVNGNALTPSGSNPPASGFYFVDLANGRIRIGSSLSGQTLTADIRGATFDSGYADRPGSLIRNIAVAYGGLADPDEIDTDAFSEFDLRADHVCGQYFPIAINLLDALDVFAGGVLAFRGFRRDGRLTARLLREPGNEMKAFTEAEIFDLSVSEAPPAMWRFRIGYQKNYHVHSPVELVGQVLSSNARVDFLTQEARFVELSDAAITEQFLLAREMPPPPVILDSAADATAVADRAMAMFGVPRRALKLSVKTQPLVLDYGDSIKITHPRLGLDSGKRFLIRNMQERSRGAVDLEVWGAI